MELYLLQPITLEKAGEKLPVCTRLGGFRFARQEVVIRIFRVELLDDVHEQRRNRVTRADVFVFGGPIWR